MGFLDELDEKDKPGDGALEEELITAEEMQYSEPVKKSKVPSHTPVRKERVEAGKERVERFRSKGKRKVELTTDNLADRVTENVFMPVLILVAVVGILMAIVFSSTYISFWSDPDFSEEPGFVLEKLDNVAVMVLMVVAAAVIAMLLSVQYRKRLKRLEDGVRRSLPLPKANSGPRTLTHVLSALVPLLLVLILALGFLAEFTWISLYSEKVETAEDLYNRIFRAEVLEALVFNLIPLALLLAAAGTPEGLKKTGKRFSSDNTMPLLVILGLSFSLLSFILYFTASWDVYSFQKAYLDGNSGDANINETIQDYFSRLAQLLTLAVYAMAIYAVSNLRLKGKKFNFEMTPAMGIALVGLTLLALCNLLNFTVLWDPDENGFKWVALAFSLNLTSQFTILIGTGLLLTEFSMEKGIRQEKLTPPFGTLWEEIREKNYLLSRFF